MLRKRRPGKALLPGQMPDGVPSDPTPANSQQQLAASESDRGTGSQNDANDGLANGKMRCGAGLPRCRCAAAQCIVCQCLQLACAPERVKHLPCAGALAQTTIPGLSTSAMFMNMVRAEQIH